MRSDWHFPLCTGEERLKDTEGRKAHATQKPEALLYRILRGCTNPGDVVLDPFFGTGTTGAVAERMRRKWVGIERENEYVDLAKRRIARVEMPVVPDEFTPPPLDAPQLRIPFGLLLEHGLLKPGARLQLGHTELEAVVQEDGTVVCGNLRGSIHKVGAQCLGKPSCNGWQHWYYRENLIGEYLPLNTLREVIRRQMEGVLHTATLAAK